MKLSRNWLSRYIDLTDLPDHDIFHRLTMTTAEFEEYQDIGGHFHQVKIGKVLEVWPHPDANKLRMTRVEVGGNEYQIVCGATNVDKGQTVPVALEGTVLPQDFKIKNSKIRGQQSQGMICSKQELGLEEKSDGIWAMEQEFPSGISLGEALAQPQDTIFDIDNKSITHRPDLWNHVGFARELSAIFNRPFHPPQPQPLAQEDSPEIRINIEDGHDTPRYCGLIVENFCIGPSPDWLRQPLEAVGLRSINNIVDLTNFVMLELGEPLHAFDKERLTGNTIFVRKALAGEWLTTLDSQQRELTPQDLVIADDSGPIALAGVMGGESTEISDKTTTLFLEAANFYSARIRRTATRVGLRTDAALRFEKSQDPEIASLAIFRTWELIQSLCPNAQARNFIDAYPGKARTISVQLSHDFVQKRLGISLDTQQVLTILNSLELSTQYREPHYHVTIPTFRATKDLSLPEDIVEEIGRVIGYDQIPSQVPNIPAEPTPRLASREFEHKIRSIMTGLAQADEVYLYSFYGPKLKQKMNLTEQDGEEIKLQNYLSDEMDRLRLDLMPNMVKAAAENLRFQERFRFFEIGRTYHPSSAKDQSAPAHEELHLGYLACEGEDIDTPFYLAREVVAKLIESLGLSGLHIYRAQNQPPYLHPGRAADIFLHNERIGYIGELHPQIMANFTIKKRLALFDINLNTLQKLAHKKRYRFKTPGKFPPAFFEITVLADIRTEVARIVETVEHGKIGDLSQVRVLKIFEGQNLPQGKKAVSLRLTFQKEDGTIDPDILKKRQDQSVQILAQAGYPLR